MTWMFLLFLIQLFAATLESGDLYHVSEGRAAISGEIPYQVSFVRSGAIFDNICNGAIISHLHILTAARYMMDQHIDYLLAVVGNTDLNIPKKHHTILSIYVHDDYNFTLSWEHNIAIIKVHMPFEFSPKILPVKLPITDMDISTGKMAIVSGYGRSKFKYVKTKQLDVVQVKIANQRNCKEIYANHSLEIYDSQICAFEPRIGRKECTSDAGGPLVLNGILIGIVSWSAGCNDSMYPSVYTRISSYINWIEWRTSKLSILPSFNSN